ncbi:MAG: type I restriction enzyme HsdR N-terminal domain-containing protein [Bacillota bacterium]
MGTVNNTPPTVQQILRGTAHALTIFDPSSVASLTIFLKRGKPYLKCLATGKERPAKPEEIVRQLYVKRLMDEYGYPPERIAIEKPVQFGAAVHEKAADIVVWDKDAPDSAFIIVECKKPKRSDGLAQLKSYCHAEGAPIGVWTNGGETIILHRRDPNYFQALSDIPRAKQTLSQLLDERWTLDDLAVHNVLVREQTTLKKIILDMENLVLANAGVDAFEEVFKLIYAKLFDESQAAQGGRQKRYLQFRVGGATPTEFKAKINDLFDAAKKKWPGVFLSDEHIDLTPEHLVTCGSYLENVRLFNSNLQVIDEAFEYLSVEVGKGKKGQYFTPRHVIDMAVKMLDPRANEFLIDTAAGSCGFTVHSIFHVWGKEFSANGPSSWQAEYAREQVYAIDFDQRSNKIAKALNLIAGDGKSNVFRANTLDPRNWDETVREGLRHRLRRFPDSSETDRWNREHFRYFDFDILLTNPPFAGDIRDSRILHQFDLAKNDNGHWRNSVGRDVLFIQRNLEFLRPGGRMAIVLPQGRLNNLTDGSIRSFVAEHARILAVVGLHVNTFRPHTSTKTSILFCQKWNDDPTAAPRLRCPRVDDYPIFFAVSEHGGKDSGGEYVYLVDDNGQRLYDLHEHPMIDHDLFNLRGYLEDQLNQRLVASTSDEKKQALQSEFLTKVPFVPDRPGIAEAFREWGRRQGLGFCIDEEDGA